MICMKNASAVEMMIRIPVVMTGEIESWPCEELMYCSRANVWQEWGFCRTGSGIAHCSSDFVQQLTQKDKVLWKGASQGSMQEQGLSTPSVTLVSLQIGFVLVNEGEGEEEKRHTSKRKGEKTVLLWLMSGSPPATQVIFVPNNIGFDLGWSCFFSHPFVSCRFLLAFPVFYFCSWLKQALNTDWKQKLVEGI